MAYTISFTDEVNNGVIVVEDGTINTETTIGLPGRNVSSYGTTIAENFLHMLENFASATAPSRAIEGQLWYDTTPGSEQLKVYDGTVWAPAGGLNKGQTQPDVANSQIGDLWVNTESQQLYLNSGSGWVLVGPEFSDGLLTGATPTILVGRDNNNYNVLQINVGSQPVAIISSAEFIPKIDIPGFSTIKPGYNLSTRNITGDGAPLYYGTAEKASGLVVNNEFVPAGSFLRNDTTGTSVQPLNIQNNQGITLGTDAALNLSVEGQAGIIQHQIEGSSIDVRVKNSGTSKTVIRIDSNLRVGINNEAPDEALDVSGNIQTDSNLFVNGTTESTTIGNGSIVAKGGVGIAKNLNVGGNSKFANLSTFANVIPDGNNTRNLGTAVSKWQTIYATEFRGNLTGNVNGTVSGVAGSAVKLNSASTFRMTGDITSEPLVFDGQTGGSEKIFVTRIESGLFSGREEITAQEILSGDEILVNVTSGDLGLKRITKRNLLASVARFTAGMILPYAGPENRVPSGWLLCDGSAQPISRYNNGEQLYDIIGLDYTPDPDDIPGQFRVPDLRGRLPLGADNMGQGSANVTTGDYADGIGGRGGSETKTIQTDNLPEHRHDLKGDTDGGGDQYYAVRAGLDEPRDTEDAVLYPNGGLSPTGSMQAMLNSGGVLVPPGTELGQPFNIMPPTLTLNYIIFTGEDVLEV